MHENGDTKACFWNSLQSFIVYSAKSKRLPQMFFFKFPLLAEEEEHHSLSLLLRPISKWIVMVLMVEGESFWKHLLYKFQPPRCEVLWQFHISRGQTFWSALSPITFHRVTALALYKSQPKPRSHICIFSRAQRLSIAAIQQYSTVHHLGNKT